MSNDVFNSMTLTSNKKRKFNVIVAAEITGMPNSEFIGPTDPKFRIVYHYLYCGELYAEFDGTEFIDQLIEISANNPDITFMATITLNDSSNYSCRVKKTTYKTKYKNGVEKIVSKPLRH